MAFSLRAVAARGLFMNGTPRTDLQFLSIRSCNSAEVPHAVELGGLVWWRTSLCAAPVKLSGATLSPEDGIRICEVASVAWFSTGLS